MIGEKTKKVANFKARIVIVDDVLRLDQYRYDSETSALFKIERAHMNESGTAPNLCRNYSIFFPAEASYLLLQVVCVHDEI